MRLLVELRSEYVIEFVPGPGKASGTLDVRVTWGPDTGPLRVIAPREYWAQ